MGRRTELTFFPKRKCRWATGTWKDAQHRRSSGKCKSKAQWDITSHLSEWLSSKNTINKCWQECEEKGNLVHCWWECKLVQPLWKTVWRCLKELKIELPYDPAIALLGIYQKKTPKPLIWKDTCTPVFIAALFIITKICNQLIQLNFKKSPKNPSD